MQLYSSRFRYGAVARSFHWLTVILVGASYILSRGGSEERFYSASNDFIRQTHESLGIAVFALVLLRLLWRQFDLTHEDPPMAVWMKTAATLTHWGLYLLLFAVPLTAIAGAWLEGHPLTLFAIGDVGPLLPQAHAFGAWLAELHTWLGNALIWIAGLHAAAALFHHFVLRDDVFVSMLPSIQRLQWRGKFD